MNTIEMQAIKREVGSRGELRRLRQEGLLPAILYGADLGSMPIQVPTKELERIISSPTGRNTLIQLEIKGDRKKPPLAIIKDIQRDPIKGVLLHVDFQQISLREKLQTEVPVVLAGTPVGVNEGGTIQVGLRSVEIECLPAEIPSALTLDVSGMAIGDKLTVADLEVPEGVKILSDPEQILVSVVSPRAAVEEETEVSAEAAGPGQPEETEDEKAEE